MHSQSIGPDVTNQEIGTDSVASTQRRKNLRLSLHDYREPGSYFVTVCTHRRREYFGEIHGGALVRSPQGEMVEDAWRDIPLSFPSVALDTWILMPNHLHGIVTRRQLDGQTTPTLGDVMRWFKTVTTNRYIHAVQTRGWPRFESRLWQPNYYDHVVRDDRDLERIRSYVDANPSRWFDDELYVR